MAKNSGVDDESDSKDTTTPSGRVRWLLDSLWTGNRSAMARDIGCSHTALVNIAGGGRKPGREILARIASHPKINPVWVWSGEGVPLLAERQEAPSSECSLPLFNCLLPGSPAADRSLAIGTIDLGPSHFRESRYAYKIPKGDKITQEGGDRLAADDILLLETDSSTWKQNLRFLDGRICAIRLFRDLGEVLQLDRIQYCTQDGEVLRTAYMADSKLQLTQESDKVKPGPITPTSKRRHAMLTSTDLDEPPKPAKQAATSSKIQAAECPAQPFEIVAAAVLVVRFL